MMVCETPNNAAWAGRRPEFKGIDPSPSVLHSLTLYFPFLEKKKNPPAARETALAPTEEGINSSRAISRRELRREPQTCPPSPKPAPSPLLHKVKILNN